MACLKKAICIINDKKIHALPYVMQMAEGLKRRNVHVIPTITGEPWSTAELLVEESLAKIALEKPDIALVFGGDGSILHAARLLAPYSIPLLGVNLGSLGFLAALEPKDLETALDQLVRCEYTLEERMLLEGLIYRRQEKLYTCAAVNDIVIHSRGIARNIILEVLINGEFVSCYRGDGVIVASPIGSTAYSLSAGGPIVMPQMKLFLVTPVAAHSMHARTIIAPAESTIEIIPGALRNEAAFLADGQVSYALTAGDKVLVRQSKDKALFVNLGYPGFFKTLREKFYSGGDSHESSPS